MSNKNVKLKQNTMKTHNIQHQNKMLRLILLTFLGIIMQVSVSAQSYFFKVLGMKGACKADNQLLKIGSNIRQDQIITVPTNGYLGLAHYSGKTLELKQAGSYKAKELESRLKAAYSPDMQRYFDIVLGELTAETNIFARRERLQKAKTFIGKGAVTRKLADEALEFVLPETSLVFEDTILLRWFIADSSHLTQKPVYQVKIFSMLDELLYEAQTTENQIAINLRDTRLQKETKAYWYSVNLLTNPDISSGEPQSFNKLSLAETQKIKKDIQSLPDDGSAIGQLILARYLEDKGLLANALFVYEKTLKENPVEHYQEIYQDFLIRNKLLPEIKGK